MTEGRGHGQDMRGASLLLALVLLSACGEGTSTPPASEAPEADVLRVRCDGTVTEILTPTVQAATDGVHVRIENTSHAEVLTQWDGGGDGADPGTSEQLIPFTPGIARFRCQTFTPDVDPGAPGGWKTVTVLAPPGWVSPTLDCPDGSYGGNLDYVEGARGVADPLADAMKRAGSDDVRLAGYVTDSERTYVGSEDGVPTERFDYVADGHGGWLLTGTGGCS